MQLRCLSRVALAYTLLEVLVVVVLMGLIAAVLIPRLAGTTTKANRDRLVSELIQLDAHARLLARRGERCTLRWDPEQHSVDLLHDRSSPKPVRVIGLDEQFFLIDQLDAVEFDSFGRSKDYTLRVWDDQMSVELRFNGVSGWHEVRADEN